MVTLEEIKKFINHSKKTISCPTRRKVSNEDHFTEMNFFHIDNQHLKCVCHSIDGTPISMHFFFGSDLIYQTTNAQAISDLLTFVEAVIRDDRVKDYERDFKNIVLALAP